MQVCSSCSVPSILLRTRTVHSAVAFIIILFSLIYASLFFAVRYVVTFEKLAKTFQFLKAPIQDLFLIYAVACDARKYKPSQIQ